MSFLLMFLIWQSSFDFGPSFMDEVLKALDEKEKQAEAASSPTFNGRDFGDDIDPNRVDLDDRTPVAEDRTPVFEEKGFSAYGERTPSSSRQAAPPPPLPSQPPRVVSGTALGTWALWHLVLIPVGGLFCRGLLLSFVATTFGFQRRFCL